MNTEEAKQLTNENTEQTTMLKKNNGKTNTDKNPDGYTPHQVLSMIKDGSIIPGSPPKERNCSSDAWKNGIHFLFTKETENNPKREVKNWYYCSKCEWIYNGLLTKGTGYVNQHYKKHFTEIPYVFNHQQLAKLLANATASGKLHGSIGANSS